MRGILFADLSSTIVREQDPQVQNKKLLVPQYLRYDHIISSTYSTIHLLLVSPLFLTAPTPLFLTPPTPLCLTDPTSLFAPFTEYQSPLKLPASF